jgi:hypothetical protein
MASANVISFGNCASGLSRPPKDAMFDQSFPFQNESIALAHAPLLSFL